VLIRQEGREISAWPSSRPAGRGPRHAGARWGRAGGHPRGAIAPPWRRPVTGVSFQPVATLARITHLSVLSGSASDARLDGHVRACEGHDGFRATITHAGAPQ
jgi:hypothetical protein